MTLDEAYALFGWAPGADVPLPELNARWRALRSDLHPDRPGGDPERFDAGRRAYDLLHRHVTRPRPCPECDGAGKVHHQRGFATLSLPCSRCRGTGEVRYHPNGEHR